MQKTKIDSENWILIALMNASERYGVDLSKWYLSKRPDELDIQWDQFSKIIDKMETEGILKRASSDAVNHCLSDKGRKEAIKLKRRLNFNDYYFIISKFPEIELKEKVETLEAFIVTSFLLIVMVFWGKLPITEYGSNRYVVFVILLIYTIIFILSMTYFSIYFAKIFLFWMVSLQKNSLWIYKEWLWNNKSKFMFSIPALFIMFLLYGVYITNLVSWQNIVWGIILILIGYIITNYGEFVSKISNFSRDKSERK